MKWHKKIALSFLFMIMINCFVLLALSMTIQKVLIDGVIKETIYEQLTKKEVQARNYITEEQIEEVTDDERIKAILSTPEMQELINKYVEITIESMTDEEKLDEVKLEEDMLNYLKDSKEQLSEIVGEKVTDEMIETTREQLETKDMSKAYKQAVQNTSRGMTTKEKTILMGYKVFVSSSFKIVLLVLLIISILISILLLKSFLEFQKVLSRTLVSSGFIIEIIVIVVKSIVQSKTSLNTLKMIPLIKIGYIYLGIGFLLRIIYEIIMRRKKHEVS